MQFIIDNYIWFIVIGVVIIMAVIGFIAEKTEFGKKSIEKKIKRQEEKDAKLKESLEATVPVENIPMNEETSSDINVENVADIPSEDLNAPLENDTTTEDLNTPLEDVTTTEDLNAPLEDVTTAEDLNTPLEDVTTTEDLNTPLEETNNDEVQVIPDDNNTEVTEETKDTVEDEEDVWKF